MTDPASNDARRSLVATRWVHVEGDDAAHGAVFRDETGDVPLSRRPKELLHFAADGTVRKLATGPDDRAHEVAQTTWSDDGGKIVFHFGAPDAKSGGASTYRVVEQAKDHLVIQRG